MSQLVVELNWKISKPAMMRAYMKTRSLSTGKR